MIDISRVPPARQFDFWLGDWDVSWGEEKHGSNHVVQLFDGRVIQENFDGNPALAFRGMSLSMYVEKLGLWRQTWVDSDGDYWAFDGGVEGDQMVLTTNDVADGKPIKLRMVFYNIEADEMDWRWEKSIDGGEKWEIRWEIHYRRRDSAA